MSPEMTEYDVHNPTQILRMFYDSLRGNHRLIKILPGQTLKGIVLDDWAANLLTSRKNDLTISKAEPSPAPNGIKVNAEILPPPKENLQVIPNRPPLLITGMFGIGDNLHQRAALRELLPKWDIYLETCHVWLYHDFIKKYGMKTLLRPTNLWMHKQNIERERGRFTTTRPNPGIPHWKIWYLKHAIDKYGSILGAMNASFFLPNLKNPDFSLPILPEWKRRAQILINSWDRKGKPLLIYRPIVLRREWDSQARNPDPIAYARLFAEIRERFFVVSLASLKPGIEWIVGDEEKSIDVKLHGGELDFETMAALFAEADMVFCNAGFAPVMAQAVGTPSVVVYGGRESFRTSNAAGAHLAPTLGIDPDNPCDCHSHSHKCDKRITLPPAIQRVKEFTGEVLSGKLATIPMRPPKTLIFGTVYQDNPDRARLTQHWMSLTKTLNPDCDLLLVDSASPFPIDPKDGVEIFSFPDNIGHLSRPRVTQGRDGWGRAFCKGLQIAIDRNYDYVVHIEGDSLFRLPCSPIVEKMKKEAHKVLSTPVKGMRIVGLENTWVETGLMFFEVKYLVQSKFIEKYDWPNRKVSPTPEVVIRRILGNDLTIMPWKAWRADKNDVTHLNVVDLSLDWITHCDKDYWAYDRFAEDTLRKASNETKSKVDLTRDYDHKFFAMHVPWKPLYENMARILEKYLEFDSALDLGCGNRYLLTALEANGKKVLGIDGSRSVLAFCNDVKIMDLTAPIFVGKYDLVICTEVAEHIDAKYADVLVRNICKNAKNTIFFSAAVAGFGGHLHVNEQERPYWLEKFKKHGFEMDLEVSEKIKAELLPLKRIWWFAANAFVLRRS